MKDERSQIGGDNLDWEALFAELIRSKYQVLVITLFCFLVFVCVAIAKRDIYFSSGILVPSEDAQGGGVSALAGQLGGLASFAGLNINKAGTDRSVLALEIMSSKKFKMNFIEKYNLKVKLLAVKGWDRAEGALIVDSSIYDEQAGSWVRDVGSFQSKTPSAIEAVEAFDKYLVISDDPSTGLISVGFEYFSPVVAEKWASAYILEINEYMRQRDIYESERSIEYLERELNSTSLADLKTVFFQLIEEQTKKIMLANARKDYIFTVIDPPLIPEKSVKPNRIFIACFGFVLGGLISVLYVLFRYFLKR